MPVDGDGGYFVEDLVAEGGIGTDATEVPLAGEPADAARDRYRVYAWFPDDGPLRLSLRGNRTPRPGPIGRPEPLLAEHRPRADRLLRAPRAGRGRQDARRRRAVRGRRTARPRRVGLRDVGAEVGRGATPGLTETCNIVDGRRRGGLRGPIEVSNSCGIALQRADDLRCAGVLGDAEWRDASEGTEHQPLRPGALLRAGDHARTAGSPATFRHTLAAGLLLLSEGGLTVTPPAVLDDDVLSEVVLDLGSRITHRVTGIASWRDRVAVRGGRLTVLAHEADYRFTTDARRDALVVTRGTVTVRAPWRRPARSRQGGVLQISGRPPARRGTGVHRHVSGRPRFHLVRRVPRSTSPSIGPSPRSVPATRSLCVRSKMGPGPSPGLSARSKRPG